jgi:hypothetical protein
MHQPAFAELPADVKSEIQRFAKDRRSATTALSQFWTDCFKKLEKGEESWAPAPPPFEKRLRSDRTSDWNQILQFNELALMLGGEEDEGLLVRKHGILDIPAPAVALQLRRLSDDLDAASFRPAAVLAHDRESVPLALALAERYGCGIEPAEAPGEDCLYVIGDLTYAGALERARLMLEELRPRRTVVAALLVTENPNALRLLPDVIGYQVGSGALPWGRAAGIGVLLREGGELGETAVADRAAFESARDRRPPEAVARELLSLMNQIEPALCEEHVMFASGALPRILARKRAPIQEFDWRTVGNGEESGDWHTLLPPFPQLFGTPLGALPDRPTVEDLREFDHEEEQLKFMEWTEPTLQSPTEVWVKTDVRGQVYTHYFAVVRRPGLHEPVAFVVETIPHGEDLALNNYSLFLDASDADELRFGRLAHRAAAPSLN